MVNFNASSNFFSRVSTIYGNFRLQIIFIYCFLGRPERGTLSKPKSPSLEIFRIIFFFFDRCKTLQYLSIRFTDIFHCFCDDSLFYWFFLFEASKAICHEYTSCQWSFLPMEKKKTKWVNIYLQLRRESITGNKLN